MKYKELEIHASNCQIASDEMAIKLINQEEVFSNISIFQSLCDFNLSFVYSISPEFILHIESIKFLIANITKFKRKLTIKELLFYDLIISKYKPLVFSEFKNYLLT